MALFLAHLGAVTGVERYTLLARRAWRALQREIAPARSPRLTVGAFNGWGGVIYALSHLAALWQESELREASEAMVDTLPALIDKDEEFDLVGGLAGCIGALLGTDGQEVSPRALAMATRCGERLLATAQPLSTGIGWVSAGRPAPLTGFSHGAAGIAWALLELWAQTGEKRFQTAALDALAFERSQFDPETKNGRDPRVATHGNQADEPEPRRAASWCYGAPGIGLARLLTVRASRRCGGP